MIRDINKLQECIFDVLVIGGGIYGACTAWDASLRGLSVAIVEKEDFGGATSANSLKIIHGGLRYLQDGNLALARTMSRERRAFMRIAPHLVHPLTCILPTSNKISRSKPVLAAALAINDLISYDRNHQQPDKNKHLPSGQVLSRDQYQSRVPGMIDRSITGGAVWHDAQAYNSERLTLSFVLAASQQGAIAANYVEAIEFLKKDNQVTGIKARDMFSGLIFDIQAKVVVNTTGPWSEELLGSVPAFNWQPNFRRSLAVNLVTRQISPNNAIGFSCNTTFTNGNGRHEGETQTLFIAPWRNYSLVGTMHLPLEQNADKQHLSARIIGDFVKDINNSFPSAKLQAEDIYLIHNGFLPDESDPGSSEVKLLRENQIIDHQQSGIEGLITVIGVKYTLARHAAEQAVDLIYNKLNRHSQSCQTAFTALPGGRITSFKEFVDQETVRQQDLLEPESIRQLIYNHGTSYKTILEGLDESKRLLDVIGPESAVIKAEIVHGVHQEMAHILSDVVLRRTELGSAGKPSDESIRSCAEIMAVELDFGPEWVEQQIDQLNSYYASRTISTEVMDVPNN